MDEADGVMFVIIGAERVGADEFGGVAGFVCGGAALWAHFVQDDFNPIWRAEVGRLPCGFATCEPCADDVEFVACIAHGVLFSR